MRTPVVMGNWKLNGTKATVADLIKTFAGVANDAANVDVAICAPALYIGQVESLATGSKLKWGSEDCDVHTTGAFTGELSPSMLKNEFNCTYAIVGHSERRGYHNESNEIVAGKFKAAQDNGLTPVLCIGESEAEYDAGKTLDVCKAEIKAVIDLCGIEAFNNAIIAYEPIWAIGTGKTATPEIAQNVHKGIREFLKTFSAEVADGVRILYGGSCNAKTAPELFSQPDIDGGLIGGASLKAPDFTAIIEAAVANA